MKIITAVAAALLSVAPVASVVVSQPINATVANNSVTTNQVFTYFNGQNNGQNKDLIDPNGGEINYYVIHIAGFHIVNAQGATLTNGNATLPDGQYRFEGTYDISGISASSEARNADLLSINGNKAQILANVVIPANATSASGNIDFTFTVNNGQVGNSSLGTATATSEDNSTSNSTSSNTSTASNPTKQNKPVKKAKKHVRKSVKKHHAKKVAKKATKKHSKKHARRSRR